MLEQSHHIMVNLNVHKFSNKIFVSFLLMMAFGILGCYFTETKQTSQSLANATANARNDSWETIGFGGGGATFYPEISPFNPEYAFVSCDMTGSYVTYNGGESWRMFNL